MPIRKKTSTENGFALLLAITVASVLLALGLTMLTVTTKQLTLSSISRESEVSFQASMAGLECMSYQRKMRIADLKASGAAVPELFCFDTLNIDDSTVPTPSAQTITITNGYINLFKHRFDWGSGNDERCTETDLYLMVNTSTSADINYDFESVFGIEAVGNKVCKPNPGGESICTIVVSRGYNKSCTDVDDGLATVQRELTSEF